MDVSAHVKGVCASRLCPTRLPKQRRKSAGEVDLEWQSIRISRVARSSQEPTKNCGTHNYLVDVSNTS